jgi:NAD(P)-dependent dehydrogenase (short-subunit alcohol dehydrogenase family)
MADESNDNVSYDFAGRVALITGGGRGQGRTHALGFARAGADVAICDVGGPLPTIDYGLGTADDLEAVAEEVRALGARCFAGVCDVRVESQVRDFVGQTVSELGRLDVLVNNAGVESIHSLAEMPEEAWDVLLDTNLKGQFLMAKHAIPHLPRGGSIICIGSTNSLGATPSQAHYTAAKHGVLGMARSLAIELAPQGITVNTICPGGVDTPMVSGMAASDTMGLMSTLGTIGGQWNLLAPNEMLSPQEITRAVLWLASDGARFVTGSALVVDAGYTIK